jgi:CheY-like chemotaxis protein
VKRVLLVEDEPVIRDLVRRALDPARYSVQAVASVPAGRLALAAPCPDLALVDLILPGGDGVALVGEAKAACPHVPVVAVTGSIDPAREARALAAGADGILRKPFSLAELRALVDRLAGAP